MLEWVIVVEVVGGIGWGVVEKGGWGSFWGWWFGLCEEGDSDL